MIKSLGKWLRENREWHRHWRKAWSASIRPDSEGVTPFQRRCFAELAKAWPRDAEPPIWVRQGRKEAFFTTAIPARLSLAGSTIAMRRFPVMTLNPNSSVGAMPTPMNSYITSLLPSASNSASTRQPSKQRLQQARLRAAWPARDVAR